MLATNVHRCNSRPTSSSATTRRWRSSARSRRRTRRWSSCRLLSRRPRRFCKFESICGTCFRYFDYCPSSRLKLQIHAVQRMTKNTGPAPSRLRRMPRRSRRRSPALTRTSPCGRATRRRRPRSVALFLPDGSRILSMHRHGSAVVLQCGTAEPEQIRGGSHRFARWRTRTT